MKNLARFGVSLAMAALTPTAWGATRPVGDSRLVAQVDATPGFPEAVVIIGGRAYVSGPAVFGNAGGPPSALKEYRLSDGALLREFVVEGEDLSRDHGSSGLAVDLLGRVYMLNTQLGLLRFTPWQNGRQEEYSLPFPDLPACLAAPPPCSPAPFDAPALPNDIAFDWFGNAYVTDTLQATIWRVPAGGGAPRIWLQDPRFISEFGPNGIRLRPDGRSLLINVTAPTGELYTVPVKASPTAADLQPFHSYSGEGPDGMAISTSGRVYVTLAFSNQVSVLLPDGTEERRFDGPFTTPTGTVPYDAPAVLAFDNPRRRVVVVNHAILTGIPEHFALFDIFVGEHGALPALPLILP